MLLLVHVMNRIYSVIFLISSLVDVVYSNHLCRVGSISDLVELPQVFCVLNDDGVGVWSCRKRTRIAERDN